ncbi:MAG TPA: NAD(P)/FAD-dependent oxidoreductase [Chthonomonadales bacterium]|nr:NAD(P)/FAD-dependent oxidoreductase [Chthonomonadales bacterium]
MLVLVAGGGIGGLCLAQGLARSGIAVSVYERDASAFARPQGFRIHISPMGCRALQACLPDELYELFCETCGESGQGFAILDEQLRELLSWAGPDRIAAGQSADAHRSASRITLRRILLEGMGENVHFGKRMVSYSAESGTRIKAEFEDGRAAEGDLLVGADGVHSAVREQLVPGWGPVDTGVVALGGTLPLSDEVAALLPPQAMKGPIIVMARAPVSLFMAVWKREESKQALLDERLAEATPACLTEDTAAQGESNYLVMGFGLLEAHCPRARSDSAGSETRDQIGRLVTSWHPHLRKLIEMLDYEDMEPRPVRTSRPVTQWETGRVTLLGDAIHSMTPYRGIGANVALKDAAVLCKALGSAQSGALDLDTALREYQKQMLHYGFEAVRDSLQMMNRAVINRGTGFIVAKLAMRALNAFPTLKQKALGHDME